MESSGAMYERFLPLKYHIEKALGVPVELRIARDYETAITDIGSGRVHIACLDPATYCEVRARYRERIQPLVKALGREGASSRSVLVAKSGSGIEKIVDVRGRKLALGNERSSFSYLIPLALLLDVGIGIRDFSSVDYLNQEDRIALSVLIGNHDVGGISESVARKYLADGLKIIKASEAIPQFFFCSTDILGEDQKKEIARILASLGDKAVLAAIDKDIERFAAAEDRDFDVVRVMIRNTTGRDYLEYGPRSVKVAVLPLYSAITIYDRYEPLMRYLSKRTGREFKLVIPKDFEDFMRVVKGRKAEFSYQNPYIFALIDKDVGITPLVTTVDDTSESEDRPGQQDSFRGVIITRDDSRLKNVKDLRNKRVMIVSRKSAGGYLSQKLFFAQMGIDVDKEMRIVDAKRQETVILGVYKGEADAGFVRESALEVVREEIDMTKIRVLAYTKSLPNWPFAAAGNAPPALVRDVKRHLIELKDREILAAAKIRAFRAADEREFEALKGY